jgi:hypothetical protein
MMDHKQPTTFSPVSIWVCNMPGLQLSDNQLHTELTFTVSRNLRIPNPAVSWLLQMQVWTVPMSQLFFALLSFLFQHAWTRGGCTVWGYFVQPVSAFVMRLYCNQCCKTGTIHPLWIWQWRSYCFSFCTSNPIR